MADWWESFESLGRLGGWIGMLLSLALIGLAAGCAIYPATANWGQWTSAGPRFVAALLLVIGLPGLFASARLLIAPIYPSAASVFPPLPHDQLVDAVRQRSEDICVCTRCHVVVPATFSTGSCPVCASSIDYQSVSNDEDADLVIAAL